MAQPILIRPGARVRLRDFDPADTSLCPDKADALEKTESHVRRMADLQRMLYAEGKHALLIVLQAMDGGGKDGTIRHLARGLSPLGCRVVSFKAPTPDEMSHDFLWRVHRETPPRAWIGIFNRSHYEDVLAARVRKLVPVEAWRGRYAHINTFEKLLADSGVTILKFFLHISRREQKKRLEKRLNDPARAWKFDPIDWDNRRHWKEYMSAYEDAIARCNATWAPWHVIPSDRKWYRNFVVSERIVAALESLRLKYPPRPGRRGNPA